MTETGPRYDYYGHDRFWNELQPVIRHQALRSTGSDRDWWSRYLMRTYCTPRRRRALVIGCGSGWVERALADLGVAEHFDAFDGDPYFVEQCEMQRGDRPISYFVADFADFVPTERYDLIVNVAALHHARYLYRLCSRLSRALTDDGIFVQWEYIGPDRNQYSDEHVAHMEAVNRSLPERFRSNHPMRPSLAQMVAVDETEAVHSSEIVTAVSHYFDVVERHDIGGGLAYQILWNNIAQFEDPDDVEAAEVLDGLLQRDADETDAGTIPALHTFMIARARSVKGPGELFDRVAKEPIREALAPHTRDLYPNEIARIVRRHRLWDPRLWFRTARQALAQRAASRGEPKSS